MVKEFWQKATSQGDLLLGDLMWHLTVSAVDKKDRHCCICMHCWTCTHYCLLAGAAEGSVIFTRLRQCAYPTNTLFLEPAWVSPVNSISISWAVFRTTHPLWPQIGHSLIFPRWHQCCTPCSNGLSGSQECVPKPHVDQFSCFLDSAPLASTHKSFNHIPSSL